jgi:predicted transcriptional regulator
VILRNEFVIYFSVNYETRPKYSFVSTGGEVSIMSSTMRALEERSQRLINALESAGVRPSVATVVVHLRDMGEATARDIEMKSGMMSHDVIQALHHLEEKNWIKECEMKAEGKGGPMELYRLTASIEDIVKHHKNNEYVDWVAFWDYVQGP